MAELLPARRGGAKALLLTVLGEFVLPTGGAAWTSSLVAAGGALGIGEKNARQAIARIADDGLIESRRHGRRVQWSLTPAGRKLLETGTHRIYEFGRGAVEWEGEWLVAHCPIPESQRALRHQLRTQLAFEGFGELSASLAVSPHPERESALRRILAELGLDADTVVLRCRTGSIDADADLVSRAWELDELAEQYSAFTAAQQQRQLGSAVASFGAIVELVHDWRLFLFVDPELPTELLPDNWAGTTAAQVFHDCHEAWSLAALDWFDDGKPRRVAAV